MRKYVLHAMCMLLPFATVAQLTNGSFAPDFTLQDLNGNSWHLYELLDQGKNVIIDFSATWCGPCWDYHESGVLNEVYAAYGPEGTDEYMVFMIEGDPDTNLDCLYDLPDCTGNSQGDWTAGTLYPIINDDNIASAYDINYWPTLYHICPNKLVTELHHPGATEIHALKDACAVVVGSNNASVVEYVSYNGTFCGSIEINPVVKVQNLGLDPMTSAIAECYVNDVLQLTAAWTGHVIPYATFLLSFDSITITENASIRVRITSVNGMSDDDLTNNDIVTQLTSHDAREENVLQLELATNVAPYGVYWELTNSDSTVLYKGGNSRVIGKEDDGGTYTSTFETYIFPIPLPGDGCYRFSIYDSLGYGVGVSHYRVTDPNGDIIAFGNDFEFYEHTLIGIDNAANPPVDNGAISRIYGLPEEFCSHKEYLLSLDLINVGTDYITQAEIELLENGHVLHAIEWTGNVAPAEKATISFPAIFFESGNNILFRIKSINGVADAFTYQNEWQGKLERHLSAEHAISIDMQLDYWAYEIYWQLTNANGDVIRSGGNTLVGPDGGGTVDAQPGDPGAYGHDQFVHLEVDLPDTTGDCYEILLVDGYGDGLLFGGFIRVNERHSGKEVVYKDYTATTFATDVILLDVTPAVTSIETLAGVADIVLYPNPAQSELQLRFETKRALPLTLSLINMLGENILHLPETVYTPGTGNISMDVGALTPGVYFLHLVSGNQHMTHKVAVIR